MVGAYDGLRHVLQCLQQNDKDAMRACVTLEVFEQFDEMRELMLDEEYKCIGKMMCFLKEFENAPVYEDMSINARFCVTYYYQLFNEQNDDFIQQRVDVIWTAQWCLSEEYKFKISEDGWVVDTVECAQIPKSK